MSIEIVKTLDNSHTLFNSTINEHYHSTNGAYTESMHIFIERAFNFRDLTKLKILEIGFGTGLNCLLTLAESVKRGIHTSFCSLEKYPLSSEVYLKLEHNRLVNIDHSFLTLIYSEIWNKEYEVTDLFKMKKHNVDFVTFDAFDNDFDIVYFDAFSPEKQPEMWTVQMFNKLYNNMSNGAVLTTYCAKGQVRRNMKEAGFIVERIAGPPGKREMLRAIKE